MQLNSTRRPYNHCRYAGNIGDVWKHYILIETLKTLSKKSPNRFHYFETHGGPGYARLGENGDWRRGIGKFMNPESSCIEHDYFELSLPPMKENFLYKGSWVLAAEFLRTQISENLLLSINEINADTLKMANSAIRKGDLGKIVKLEPKNGYESLNRLQHADFVLIDPPYRSSDGTADDWEKVYAAVDKVLTLNCRWMVWYPLFRRDEPDELIRRADSISFEFMWAPEAPGWVMKGCGMLVDPGTADILMKQKSQLLELATSLEGAMTIRNASEIFN